MRAAIYTRFSSDKQREASSEDQRRNCERRAIAERWEIVAQYNDEAITGSRNDRPQYVAMQRAALAGEFDAVLVDDLSRLSRDDVETKTIIRRFKFRGLRIVGVSDGYDSAAKGEKIQSTMRGLMNDIFLDDLREKTHRGLEGQAIKGNNAGGRAYGYKHMPIEDPTRLDPLGRPVVTAVRREIDPIQAAVVVRIFTWYADGRSPRAIAETLNREGIPSPGANWNRRRPQYGWAATAIAGPSAGTGILNNEMYVGRYVWNRRKWTKDPDTGRRQPANRPQSEWIVNELPALRIVPDELWHRVKARQSERSNTVGDRVRAGLRNARSSQGGAPGKFLFSTMLKCGICGANFVMTSATHYGCASRTNGRQQFCTNSLRVGRGVVESRLLAGIKSELLTPAAIQAVRARVQKVLADRQKVEKPDANRIATLRTEIANLGDAIANGLLRSSPTLAKRLAAAESELERLQATTSTIDTKITRLLPEIADHYRQVVDELGKSALRDVGRARAQIRALLGDAIKLFPAESGDFLEAEIAMADERMVKLAANSLKNQGRNNVVAGAGFEPATFGL